MAVDIRLIATDLDGTLVHNSTDISDANIAALKAAVDGGRMPTSRPSRRPWTAESPSV